MAENSFFNPAEYFSQAGNHNSLQILNHVSFNYKLCKSLKKMKFPYEREFKDTKLLFL